MQSVESVKFSSLVEHNSCVSPVLSPTGNAIASVGQSQLQVWDVDTKKIIHRFDCDNLIDFIKWSPDSALVCFGTLKNCVLVRNLEMPHWKCKINGDLIFENILWGPDSRHLLVVSEFYIKMTIYSLMSSISTEIDNLKAIENAVVFSCCEKYMVAALRINFEDRIGLYSCDSWETLKVFPIETNDMTALSFSPVDLVIAVLGSVLEYKILLYSIDGRILGKYNLEASLNIVKLSWHPYGKYISIGDFAGEVKVLDRFNANVIASYIHSDISESNVTVYRILGASEAVKQVDTAYSSWKFDEVVKDRPVALPVLSCNEKRKSKKLRYGIQSLQFSSCGKFVASVDANSPKVVFIYNIQKKATCSVVIRESNIKSICWHPEKPFLLICSSSCAVDVWSPKFCLRFISPFKADFAITEASWNVQKDCILLSSNSHFSLLFHPKLETCLAEE